VSVASPEPIEVDLRCPECDYNLTGAPGDRCPWCGWDIDVDALVSAAVDKGVARRWAVAVTGLVVATASVVALSTLLWSQRRGLSMWDAAAVVAVLVAAAGHAALGLTAASSHAHWPMRHRTLAELLRLAGWLSVIAGVAGGLSVIDAAPTPRFVRGVKVNGVLEFVLTAMLYALPGLMLLGLRFIAFAQGERRRMRGAPGTREVAPFRVDAMERLEPSQLTQSWTDSPRPTTPNLEAEIAGLWEQSSEAVENRRALYNGDLIRVAGFTASPRSLHMQLGQTCFRDFVGTNLRQAAGGARLGATQLANPLGVSAVVATRDGFLAFGRRRTEVAYHGGFLHTFGGLVEASDRRADSVVDVVGAMLRELHEEALVDRAEVGEVWITGLVRDRSLMQPELLFEVAVSLARPELSRRFDPTAADQEHTAIEFVHDEPESIVPFLQRSAPVAPVAAAALLLHGRHAWGMEWYEQACLVLYGALPERD